MKKRPILFSAPMVCAILDGRKTQTRRVVSLKLLFGEGAHVNNCPYGKPGDRLWVRETWSKAKSPMSSELFYRADGESNGKQYHLSFVERESRWRPSIHMPRWASRILLEVTNVRVERLQDISEEDAIAEGAYIDKSYPKSLRRSTKSSFELIWKKINGKDSWDLNPLVWVVEFKVLRTTRVAA